MLEHQSSRHWQAVDHRFLSILLQCCEALVSETHHPAVPRWPFCLRWCWWRAWNHSGSTGGKWCQLVLLVHSCMATSVSASWQAEHPSVFSDLPACSAVLELLGWWSLLPFQIFCSLQVFQFPDPMVFQGVLILFVDQKLQENKPSPKIKEGTKEKKLN